MHIKNLLKVMQFILLLAMVSCSSITQLNDKDTLEEGLQRADSSELRQHLLEYFSSSGYPPPVMAPMPAGNASPAVPAYSTTNVQEQGVDEADLIKTDGRYIYALGSPNNQQFMNDTLRIMQVSDRGKNLTEVRRLKITNKGTELQNLYLAGNKRLAVLGNAYHWPNLAGNMPTPVMVIPERTELQYIDVSNPATAKPTLTLNMDGHLIASRRVKDTLYLVLQTYPDIQGGGFLPYAVTDDDRERNKKLLAKLNTEDFLPHYRLNNGEDQALIPTDSCYINQQENKENPQRNEITSIVALDLTASTLKFNSRCFIGATETLYASPQALYLATADYHYDPVQGARSSTGIHKFAFSGTTVAYRGSGEVPGNLLGWSESQRAFRLSEHNGYLRILTQNDTFTNPSTELIMPYGKSPVILSILKEGGKSGLMTVSQLPNRQRPAHLGKLGEQLYASRFIGDSAYLVTFQTTDPLYALDLRNPHDPYIAGELQIPGFSDYLHPVGNKLLLGIGKDALPDPNGDFRGAWYQGMKLALYDISKPDELKEVDKLILGKRGTDSASLHDHHAVTVLPDGNTLRIALPVSLHDTPTNNMRGHPSDYYEHTQTGLYRFEVDQNARKIIQLPPLITEKDTLYWRYPDKDRSVIMGDYVHYFHNGAFWSQDWAGKMAATSAR